MSKPSHRSFSTDFKVRVVERIETGSRLSAVADEMGIRRKLLYQWRAAFRALGVAGLNQKRGPKPGGKRKSASARGGGSSESSSLPDAASSSPPPRAEATPVDERARADARIAELERVIGRQQADLYFFREALRLWDAKRPTSGARISTKSSER